MARRMHILSWLLPVLILDAAAAAEIAPSRHCADLVGLTIPGFGAPITKARPVAAAPAGTVPLSPGETVAVALPSYCLAEGSINPHKASDGKAYATGFALALPDQWNGRFLFQGGGGLNGTVRPPLGGQATGTTPALARGFAVVSTDSGHQGAVFDRSFMADQQASLDFANRAVGQVTLLAKRVIAAYFATPAKHSYFVGCSTGGREGMLMTQRYPEEFDGVVAGAPAMRTGNSNLGLLWATAAFNRIATKDASGKPVPGSAFSPADKKLITGAILAACDATDGVTDGMIEDPQNCHFDPAVLQCQGAKTDTCLGADQVDALHRAFAGPIDSRGHAVYAPFLYDTGIAAATEHAIPGFLPSTLPSPLGPPDPSLAMDVDAKADAVAQDAVQQLTDTASWTNLNSFSGHGGKLIFFHGTSDPWFSALDTVQYYQRMAQDNGGAENTAKFSLLFLVPGMSHCMGGPAALDRFDLLSPLVAWVENGTPPEATATGAAFPGRSRPLCPYPTSAHYTGHGNSEDAANFQCR